MEMFGILQGVLPDLSTLRAVEQEALLRLVTRTVSVGLLLFIGLPLVFGAGRAARGWVGRRYSPQRGLIAGKVVLYAGSTVLLLTTLGQLGVQLGPLLGAAGVVGVAIGFASQTSVSNVISGFFLIAEQPFQVDDVIQIGGTTGRVLSIDMLSVKLRTFDNRFVRIPNESIVKSEVVTLTRFPIRRIDLMIGVAYRENIGRVRELLLEVARENRAILMEPEPAVQFEGFGASSVDLRFVCWATRENFVAARNTLAEGVKEGLDAAGIEIPFPHVSLYAGSDSAPIRVQLEPAREALPPAGAGS